ncbi:hypothetical protein BDZ89DRAFT_638126 [Hymenopellis radicata]|nr:hypothetical protein BDZ89DRAFT_638126 [Hymenopellis radicata]
MTCQLHISVWLNTMPVLHGWARHTGQHTRHTRRAPDIAMDRRDNGEPSDDGLHAISTSVTNRVELLAKKAIELAYSCFYSHVKMLQSHHNLLFP